jgi:hypothetical protein
MLIPLKKVIPTRKMPNKICTMIIEIGTLLLSGLKIFANTLTKFKMAASKKING